MMPGGKDRSLAMDDHSHFGFALASREEVDEVADLARREGCLIWEPRDEPYPVGYYRSEEHTSELQSLMRISYAVFCLKKKKQTRKNNKPYILKHDIRNTTHMP